MVGLKAILVSDDPPQFFGSLLEGQYAMAIVKVGSSKSEKFRFISIT